MENPFFFAFFSDYARFSRKGAVFISRLLFSNHFGRYCVSIEVYCFLNDMYQHVMSLDGDTSIVIVGSMYIT